MLRRSPQVRRRTVLLLAQLVAIALLSSGAPAASQPARITQAEPMHSARIRWLHSFGEIQADGDRVYVSSGRLGSSVAVFNRAGTQVGLIEHIPGASGIEIVHHILYVAAFRASRIDRFDLTTTPPTRMDPLSTDPLPRPQDLVFAGRRLWFTSGCNQWGSRVARIDLHGTRVRELHVAAGVPPWSYCTAIEQGPARPDRIFLHNTGVRPQNLYQFDIHAGSAPTQVNSTEEVWSWGSYNGVPLVTLPGGEFVTGQSEGIAAFRTRDFSGPTLTYTGERLGIALAATNVQGGMLAAAVGPFASKIRLWRLGIAEVVLRLRFEDDGGVGELFPDGLAFSDDGSRLYAVTGYRTQKVWLNVIDASLPA